MSNFKHIEGTFVGQNGLNLYYQGWIPESEIRSVIVLAHGIAEHSGRYADTSAYFASRGLAVYGFDYRGHGRSPGKRCNVESFSYLINDLHIFLEYVRTKYPTRKIILLGHSMGVAVILSAMVKNQKSADALILSGTPLRAKPNIPPFAVALLQILSAFIPEMRLYKLNSDTLSRDKAVVQAYDRDPMVYRGKLKARLTIEFLQLLHRLEYLISEIRLPVLILHGTEDRLCSPEGAKLAYERIGSSDKTIKFYEQFYHEILNEPERELVLSDIEHWIKLHL